jgi:hypothetical protein
VNTQFIGRTSAPDVTSRAGVQLLIDFLDKTYNEYRANSDFMLRAALYYARLPVVNDTLYRKYLRAAARRGNPKAQDLACSRISTQSLAGAEKDVGTPKYAREIVFRSFLDVTFVTGAERYPHVTKGLTRLAGERKCHLGLSARQLGDFEHVLVVANGNLVGVIQEPRNTETQMVTLYDKLTSSELELEGAPTAEKMFEYQGLFVRQYTQYLDKMIGVLDRDIAKADEILRFLRK